MEKEIYENIDIIVELDISAFCRHGKWVGGSYEEALEIVQSALCNELSMHRPVYAGIFPITDNPEDGLYTDPNSVVGEIKSPSIRNDRLFAILSVAKKHKKGMDYLNIIVDEKGERSVINNTLFYVRGVECPPENPGDKTTYRITNINMTPNDHPRIKARLDLKGWAETMNVANPINGVENLKGISVRYQYCDEVVSNEPVGIVNFVDVENENEVYLDMSIAGNRELGRKLLDDMKGKTTVSCSAGYIVNMDDDNEPNYSLDAVDIVKEFHIK